MTVSFGKVLRRRWPGDVQIRQMRRTHRFLTPLKLPSRTVATMKAQGFRVLAALAAAVVGVLAFSSCGEHAPELTPEEYLTEARETLIDAGSIHLTLTGSDLPEQEESYIISADGQGSMSPPAFKGKFTARFRGVQADMPAVAVEGKLFVKLPFAPSHVELDPATFNVPDPATLLDKDSGLVSLLSDTEDPKLGERIRIEKEVARQIVGTLPADAVRRVLTIGHTEQPFDVTYGIVEDNTEVRTVAIRGQFYPPVTSSYSLTLDRYGEQVAIERP